MDDVIQYEKKLSIDQILIVCLLFFASMNVFGKYFYCIFFALCVLLIMNRKLIANFMLVVVCLFSLTYVIALPDARSSYLLTLKQFSYPICYFVGLNFGKRDQSTNCGVESGEKSLTITIFVVAMGAFVHYLINMFTNIESLSRNTIDIWSGKILSATGQAALAVLAAAIFWTIIFSSKPIIYKMIALAGCILVFAYNLILSGRMLLLLNVLLFVECFFFTMTNGGIKHNVKMFLLMMVLFVAVYVVFRYNLLGITELIGDSNLVSRFEDYSFYEDGRMSTKLMILLNWQRF